MLIVLTTFRSNCCSGVAVMSERVTGMLMKSLSIKKVNVTCLLEKVGCVGQVGQGSEHCCSWDAIVVSLNQ